MPTHKKLIDDLQSKVANTDRFINSSRHRDLSDRSSEQIYEHLAGLRASIVRVSGVSSAYDTQAETAVKDKEFIGINLRKVQGIAKSLLADAQAGMLENLTALVHAETFVDFIEMAEYLLSEGYKDAAAVIAGSSLESHLRNLGRRFSIPVETPEGKPLKSDRINADLASGDVYNKLDQKNVTAWLDLRNKAAHGHYTEYSNQQVELLCAAIRDFVTRNPG